MLDQHFEPTDREGVVASRAELIDLGRSIKAGRNAAGRRVATTLAGANASRYCGPGLEFAEVREYQPGDDVRAIDWRVTARTGRVHSKLFEAERERPVWFAVDMGHSMRFATRGVFKSVAAARAAALLAWQAYRSSERIGGIVASPGVSVDLPPGRTRAHLLRFLEALAAATDGPFAVTDETPLRRELGFLAERARTGSRIVVLSDFYALDDGMAGQLASLAKHSEVMLVWVYDSLEAGAPPPGRYRVTDGDGIETFFARRSTAWRNAYAATFMQRGQRLRRLAACNRVALVPLRTDQPVSAVLVEPRVSPLTRRAS